MEKIVLDEDLLAAYHFNWKVDDGNIYFVEFKLYEISWISYNGKTGERDYPSYHDLENYDISSDKVPNDKTLPLVEGHIKWDGCCNYQINEEPMFHRCGLGGFKDDFLKMEKIFKLAADIMGDTCDLDMMGLK